MSNYGVRWDDFFLKNFHPVEYNCLHFSSDVWEMLTGVSIREQLTVFLADHTAQRARRDVVRQFEELISPEDPCLAVMQRPRGVPHVGIYVRGKIFHIHETGVEYQPVKVAMRGFKVVRFYRCNG